MELVEGDVYVALRERGPFELVFADGGRPFDWEAVVAATAPGGLIVKDDLTRRSARSTATRSGSSSSATRGSSPPRSSSRPTRP